MRIISGIVIELPLFVQPFLILVVHRCHYRWTLQDDHHQIFPYVCHGVRLGTDYYEHFDIIYKDISNTLIGVLDDCTLYTTASSLDQEVFFSSLFP